MKRKRNVVGHRQAGKRKNISRKMLVKLKKKKGRRKENVQKTNRTKCCIGAIK